MTVKHIREKVEAMLRSLAGVVQSFKMYGQGHAIPKRALKDLHAAFTEIFADTSTLTIGIIGKEIAFEKEPFYETSRQIEGFIEHLNKVQIAKVSFRPALTVEELSDFISIMIMNESAIEAEGGLDGLMMSRGIRNIVLGELGMEKGQEEEVSDNSVASANETFEEGEKVLKEVSDNVEAGKDIDLKRVRYFVNSMINKLMVNKSSFLILTAVKSHDEYSFIHNINVAIFAVLQAEGLELEKGYVNEIGVAALLHDVGKLAIPREILEKQEALNEEEFRIVKSHPVHGAKILLDTDGIPPLAQKVALEHHIMWDKSGYPERRYGRPTDLATMIVAVADVYDTHRTKSPYRGEKSPEVTYQEMEHQSGKYFNSDLLEFFFQIIGVYPPGTLVELDSGEIGLVIKESSQDINRPDVELIYDKEGKLLSPTQLVKLMTKDPETGQFTQSIKRSILPTHKIRVPEKYLI